MGFEISADQLRKLNAYLQDGKIDAAEAKEVFGRTLSETELQQVNQQLQQLGGEPGKPVDRFVKRLKQISGLDKEYNAKARQEFEEYVKEKTDAWNAKNQADRKALAENIKKDGVFTLNNIVDAAKIAYNEQQRPGYVESAVGGNVGRVVVAAVAVGFVLASCTKIDMNQYQFQESNRKELNEIIKLLTQIAGDVSTIKDKQITKDDLDKYMNNFKIYLDNFRKNVTDGFGNVIEGQKNNLSMLEKIYDYLEKNVKPGDQAAILALMQKIIDKIDELSLSNQDIGEDITAKIDQLMALVTKFGNSQAESLDKIVDLMIEGNANTGAILALLQDLKPGESKDEEILAVLEKILVQVTQNGQENDENFATVIALLTDIKNGQKLTNEQLKVLIDLMKQGNVELNLIKQLLENNQVNFEDLKKLIVESNNIAKGTQDLVANLQTKVDAMDANRKAEAQAILDAIKNIPTGGGEVVLTTIENLLKQLLQLAEDGNKKLTDLGNQMIDINAAIKIVQNTLLRIEDKIKNIPGIDQERLYAILLDIYNKIPDGCECDPAQILAKLEVIIKVLQEGGKNHEGILEDLEDLFK
ncbi:MAG: hypothetical protein MJ231_04575 [bacterium]|nr:hypothetical protein [bacterium]